MQTIMISQRPAYAIDFRTDRSDTDKKMVVRAPRQWVSGGIESCTRTIGLHIESLDRPMLARVLVKAGQIIMWIVVIEAVLPPTLLPTVGGNLASGQCVSDWGDHANASLGYTNHLFMITEQGRIAQDRQLCIRSWLKAENILPCKEYAVFIHVPYHTSFRLKHQLAIQENTTNGWITREYPELEMSFWKNNIGLRGVRNNSDDYFIMYYGSKNKLSIIWNEYSPPDPASIPTNLCAAYASASTAATVVGQTITSLMNYTQSQCCTGMPNNATMIASEQEESSAYWKYKMIAIGFGGIAALLASAGTIFYVIKKRLRAAERDPDVESMHLKNVIDDGVKPRQA